MSRIYDTNIKSTLSIMSTDVHAWFYQQRFETIPLAWIPEKRIFKHVYEKQRLLLWTLNTFLATVLGNGCCIFILTKEFLSPLPIFSYEVLIVQFTLCVFAGFWFTVFVASIFYGNNFVTVWNSYRKLLLEAQATLNCK